MATSAAMGAQFQRSVDSIYLGGGTPTLLDITQLRRLFVTISQNFDIQPTAEVTVECAPGTVNPEILEVFRSVGVNRVSLGAQSFVDREATSVGRLHSKEVILSDIGQLRDAGIGNLNIDLIAGLPHQTVESWAFSLEATIATGVPHVSVYMLEVDEDSRLGRELIAGGTKYHAHFVPNDDLTADFYVTACERLARAGIQQYEISNFARDGSQSVHNLKYWTRQPYLGFGVDAHSMLYRQDARKGAVRFSSSDALEKYVAGEPMRQTEVDARAALEESFFLGLRLNRGINLREIATQFGEETVTSLQATIQDLVKLGLLEKSDNQLRLTPRGRLLSNEVFERFISISSVG